MAMVVTPVSSTSSKVFDLDTEIYKTVQTKWNKVSISYTETSDFISKFYLNVFYQNDSTVYLGVASYHFFFLTLPLIEAGHY